MALKQGVRFTEIGCSVWDIESFEKACKFIGSSRVAARMLDEGVIAWMRCSQMI